MKKIYFFTLILFNIIHLIYAQNTDINPEMVINSHISDVVPKAITPEAANLGKFGNIPMNLSSGQLELSIPLYDIKIGDYKLPIYLTYNYSGLRPYDATPITGLGWTLHAGGCITREKRGLEADEQGFGYVAGNIARDYILPVVNDASANMYYLNQMSIGSTEFNLGDTQPDRFFINMEGLSGKYVHNEDGQPVFIPYQNYVVEDFINNHSFNNDKISVTDDKGNRFIFNKAIYSHDEVTNSLSGMYYGEWWITKIKPSTSNKEIIFDYYEGSIPFNKRKLIEIQRSFTMIEEHYSRVPIPNICKQLNEHIQEHDIYNELHLYQSRALIKTIYFPYGKIEFQINHTNHLQYYLSEVKVFNKTENGGYNADISYHFEYNDINSDYKLLKKIRKFKKGHEEPFYSFDYYEENNLLTSFSVVHLGIDEWGYYNEAQNSSILPINQPDLSPNFEKTRMGALKKIIYPTQGYTEINYESNDIFERELPCNQAYVADEMRSIKIATWYSSNDPFNIPRPPYQMYWFPSYFDANNNIIGSTTQRIDQIPGQYGDILLDMIGSNYTKTENNDLLFLSVKDTATINEPGLYAINLTVGIHPNVTDMGAVAKFHFSQPQSPYLNECFNMDNNNAIDSLYVGYGSNNSVDSKTIVYQLPANTEIISEIRTNSIHNPGNNPSYSGHAFSGLIISKLDTSSRIINKEVGGIRVKQTKDCPDNTGQKCINRNYSYCDNEGRSVGKVFNILPDINNVFIRDYDPLDGTYSTSCRLTTYTTSPSNFPPSFAGNFVYYNTVTEEISNNENNKEMGKIIYRFNEIPNILWSVYKDHPEEQVKTGKLKRKEIYRKDINTNAYNIEKTTDITYQLQQLPEIIGNRKMRAYLADNIITRLIYQYSGYFEGIEDCGIREERAFWYKNKTQIDSIFLDNGVVSTDKIKSYDYTTGLLEKESFLNSTNKEIEYKYYYPKDITDIASLPGLPDLTNDELQAYNMMKRPDYSHLNYQNKVSIPVQTEKYVGKVLMERQRKTFKNWGILQSDNGNSLETDIIAPEKILTAKSSLPLEEQVVYHSYDNYGNPVEISKKDGTHIYYIWGYNHTQPIAKITNLTAADITAYLQTAINNAVQASDNDFDEATENILRQKLNDLKQELPLNTTITYYTYDPLIGVTSITDEKGETQFYKYDNFNRLEKIVDKNGNILKEFQYHYKN